MVRHVRTLTAAVLLLIVPAASTTAQSEEAPAGGDVLVVTGVEYAFLGLPTSVPVGTRLGFTNSGAEVHELALYRVADDVTASVEELVAMYFEGQDPEAAGLVEMIGGWPLYAAPGGAAPESFALDREGRYAMICLIPQGLTDIALLEGLGPGSDPAQIELPKELQALMGNPPHVALGMVGEFTVTAAGTTLGSAQASAVPDLEGD